MASADRLIEVFTEAKARPAGAERDHFLSEACRNDPQLKEQTLSLLQAHEGAGDFLKHTHFIPLVSPLTEKPGDRIGRYKLLEQIGEGGCGVVYMAEQEEPVRRRVALKVIKLGMDTKQVIARFEAERQALALMDHPNIAKVLEAGATDTGRPFFVMELVRGIKITDYCDQNNLSTSDRLELFIQVCHAIQHAHQKGIIHRDIKPSNILVSISEPGSAGCPKVIDFGIAKATTGQRLTDKTVFTAFEQFLGTPAYMSPEQAMMTSLDIDTRTDIYALGVLLYELLTGQTPFDAKDLMAAGLDAMRHIIREQEPARPSTRLSTLLAADLTIVASHRNSEPARLGTLLRGDLDWIVMKALEKNRSRRYETANGLAMDIQRHLTNEPVVARPPSRSYRFQKLVRRNKLAFAAGTAVAIALIVGLGLSTWLFLRERLAVKVAAENALRAEANEKKAAAEAAKSQQVANFLQTMLKSVGPRVALGRDTTLLREILDKTAARIGRDLTNQPEVELELRITLCNAYLAIGEAEKTEAMARAIVRLTQSFPVAENVRAAAWQRLGFILRANGKLDEAEQCGLQALAAYRKMGGKRPGLAEALTLLSRIRNVRGMPTEAEALLREAVAINREMFGNEHVNTGVILTVLAYQLREHRKSPEAESVARESLAILKKRLPSVDGRVVASLHALAGILGDQGQWAEVENLLRDELATRRQREHPDTIMLLNQFGLALQKQGRLQESEATLREALAGARKTWANNPSYYLRESFERLLEVLTLEGKLAEAETLYRDLLVVQKKQFGDIHREVEVVLVSLARVLQQAGQLTEAEALAREALAMRRKLLGNEHTEVARALDQLTYILRDQARLAEAEATARESFALHKRLFGNANPDTVEALKNLAEVLGCRGNVTEAKALFLEAAEHANAYALNEIAWTLATDAAPKLRDGPAALTLAEKAVAGTQRKDPMIMDTLAAAYAEVGQFTNAVRAQQEAIALLHDEKEKNDYIARLNLYESGLPYRDDGPLAERSSVLLAERKFAEAEPLARQCLALRERLIPDDWLTFNARSMLGGSLLGQKKYAETEPLLLSGYEGMKQREDKIPVASKRNVKEALQRLAQLYEATGQTEEAAEWSKRLAEFDQAEQKAGAPKP